MIRYGVFFVTALFFLVLTSPVMAEKEPCRAAIDADGVQRVEIVGGGNFISIQFLRPL